MNQHHTVTLNVPSVPHGPVGVDPAVADADYYRAAARNIRHAKSRGQKFAGSNLTETVAALCDAVADVLSLSSDARGASTRTRPVGEPAVVVCGARAHQRATDGHHVRGRPAVRLSNPLSDLAPTTISVTVAGNATGTCSIAAPGYAPVTAAADANGTATCTLTPTAPAAEEAPAA